MPTSAPAGRTAINHLNKECWLKIAERWVLMAQEAEAADLDCASLCRRARDHLG
jgi:hypothetical protein